MLQNYVKENVEGQKLLEIAGVGPINASLLLSYLGNAKRFASGKHANKIVVALANKLAHRSRVGD